MTNFAYLAILFNSIDQKNNETCKLDIKAFKVINFNKSQVIFSH